MDFVKSLLVAASGLRAQTGRMQVIAENIANADSTAATPGGDPYRRKIPTFRSYLDQKTGVSVVALGPVEQDKAGFRTRYEPENPGADALGYVKLPNVNSLIETVDMRSAQRSYEANLNVISSTRSMILKTLDILRG